MQGHIEAGGWRFAVDDLTLHCNRNSGWSFGSDIHGCLSVVTDVTQASTEDRLVEPGSTTGR